MVIDEQAAMSDPVPDDGEDAVGELPEEEDEDFEDDEDAGVDDEDPELDEEV